MSLLSNKKFTIFKDKITPNGKDIHIPFEIDYSKFLQYDYILKILQEIQKILINEYANQNQKSSTQLRKNLSSFLNKVLLGLFDGNPKEDLYSQQKANRLLLQSCPSKFCLYIEAFIDYLHHQSPIISPKLFLSIISRKIKQQIANQQANITTQNSSSRLSGVKLRYQCRQQEDSQYRVYFFECKTKIKKISSNRQMIKLRTTKFKWDDAKDQIEEIKYKIVGRLQKESAINFINEIYEAIISIFYIENFINGQRQPAKEFTHFQMHCPSYSQIAVTKSFQLAITQQMESMIIQVIIPKNSLKLMARLQAQNYFQEIKKIVTGSSNSLEAKFHNALYLIDKESKLGKGSYGVVHSGVELRLQRVKIEDIDLKAYWLCKSNIAIKKMPLQKGSKSIPQNRQHLILTLIRQIQYKQAILSTQRQLGLFVRNSSIGASNIVTMRDYFRQQKDLFIVFEQLKSITKDSLLEPNNLYAYSLSIWKSMHFLHHQVAEQYPEQLERYFQLQKSEKGAEYSGLGKPIGICHRDIKPTNILQSCNQSHRYILIDFGFALIMAQRQDRATKSESLATSGSQYYMAPEITMGNYTCSIDLWSSGVLLYDKRSQIQKKEKFYYAGMQVKNIPSRREELQTKLSEQYEDIWSSFLYYSIRVDPDKRRLPKEGITFLLENAFKLKAIQYSENIAKADNMFRVSDILQNSLWPVSIQLQIVQKCYNKFMNNANEDLKDFINFLSTAKIIIENNDNQVSMTVAKGEKTAGQKSIQSTWQYLRIQQVITPINKKYVVLSKWPPLVPYGSDNPNNNFSNLRFGVYLNQNISKHIRLFNIANLSQPTNENVDVTIEQVNLNLLIRSKCSIKQSIFWFQSKMDKKQIDVNTVLEYICSIQSKSNSIKVKVEEFDSLFYHSNLTEIAKWNQISSIVNFNTSSLNLFMNQPLICDDKFKNTLLKFIQETKGWSSKQMIDFNFYYHSLQTDYLNTMMEQQQKQQSLYYDQKIYKILERFKNIFYLFAAIQSITFYRIKIQRIINGIKEIQHPSQYQHRQLMEQLTSLTKNRNLIQSLIDLWKTCKQQTLKYKIAVQAEKDYHYLLRLSSKKSKQPEKNICLQKKL